MLSNSHLAFYFIQELLNHEVGYFVLSPGSRSTPIVLAAAASSKSSLFTHFDERGASFHALGYSMSSGNVGVMITTSGSALANIYPAILESFYAKIPLLLLTADRPLSSLDRSYNQTIDQRGIFSKNLLWEKTLSETNTTSDVQWTAAHALYLARNKKGPVHVNFHFDENLYPSSWPEKIETRSFSFPKTFNVTDTSPFTLDRSKKGMIIIGELQDLSQLDAIYALADHLQWPVICDIRSQYLSKEISPYIIRHGCLLCKIDDMPSPDIVVHFGGKCIDKHLFLFLQRNRPSAYIHCNNATNRVDPFQLVTDTVIETPTRWIDQLVFVNDPSYEWFSFWKEKEEKLEGILTEAFLLFPMAEPTIMHNLSLQIPEKMPIFLGNSLPIRNGDFFFSKDNKLGKIFCNRGCSGIDGNIATAAGIAQGEKKPTFAIIGDQTALHDCNSLAQCNSIDYPLVIFVINNGGGAIFSTLPIHQSPYCSAHFYNEHSFTFEGIATSFGLTYYTNRDCLLALQDGRSSLVEVSVDNKQNIEFNRFIESKFTSFVNKK